MRRTVSIITGAVVLLTFITLVPIVYSNLTAPSVVASWDFTNSRAPAIVDWPTDKTRNAQDRWAPRQRIHKQVTIILPGRPKLVSEYPSSVFVDRMSGQITKIKINERPVTREQALERLRALAKEWDWPWQENEYQKWVKRTDAGTTSRIGAGDRLNSGKVPYVGASIIHAAATPERPWYVQLNVAWPEDTMKNDRDQIPDADIPKTEANPNGDGSK